MGTRRHCLPCDTIVPVSSVCDFDPYAGWRRLSELHVQTFLKVRRSSYFFYGDRRNTNRYRFMARGLGSAVISSY